jgi:hypothetical protein
VNFEISMQSHAGLGAADDRFVGRPGSGAAGQAVKACHLIAAVFDDNLERAD